MILYLPIVAYVLFILWVSYHWSVAKEQEVETLLKTSVSILIPIKNELGYIPQLLNDLTAQHYPKQLREFIFIDDHSSDRPEQIVQGGKEGKIIVNEGEGKKAALVTGLKYATGELIVTIDADCSYGVNWLKSLVNAYEMSKAALLIGPVKITPGNTLWEKMQALEFQSLVASAAGAALGRHPIMCNGANLAFQKRLYNAEDDVFKQAYASGDDMFLLEYAKRKNVPIAYVKSVEAVASTKAVQWSHFWRQRFRWTSKSGGYRDVEVIISGGVVLLANLSLFILLFVSLKMALVALLLKCVVDVLLLSLSGSFFGQQKLTWLTLFLTPIYPIYVLISVVGGLFSRKWK